MYKVGINFDEISDDLDIAMRIMRECGTQYGELRTINRKNFVFWTDNEVDSFRQKIEAAGIELVAATSPLFKWYVNTDDPEIAHDSFGFNPRLSDSEKRHIIERTLDITHTLSIPRIRIFAGLGRISNPGIVFAQDPLLSYALNLADKYSIDLLIENEPPCRIHTRAHILELLENQNHPHLKVWLDVANMIEVGEDVDKAFIRKISNRLGYVHIKDFVIEDNKRRHVPVGEGQVDYHRVLADICAIASNDLVFTVETHAKENKIEASVKSLLAAKELVKTAYANVEK